ncbi:MAG TPA: glycosyltransferase family 2 protein [Candidatus Nanoarchaeia archaeon]|nr:glycosyltransferase family 2 protein [Candidatus Nanoarchaeia archaeon]
MFTLKQKIVSKSNDYIQVEQKFRSLFNEELVTEKNTLNLKKIRISLSIIIPAYNSHAELIFLLESLMSQNYKKFEIILVDDGSSLNIKKIVSPLFKKLKIIFITLSSNKGRSYARNVGLQVAKYEDIIFLDSDLVLSKYFIANVALRLQYTTNCVFVTFKENICRNKFENIGRNPLIEKDWRYTLPIKNIPKRFLRISLNEGKGEIFKELHLIKKTNYLKEFGFGRVIGFWDLSSMVIGHGLACKKSAAMASGGFPEIFNGWGMEDIAFGANMIAYGQFIVPLLNCTSFHIDSITHKHLKTKKITQLKKNIQKYFYYVNKKRSKYPIFLRHSLRSNHG